MKNIFVRSFRYIQATMGDAKWRLKDEKKYRGDIIKYKELNTRKEFEYTDKFAFPCVSEYRGQAGYPGTYFYQDLWGAQRVVSHIPSKHYDIGSRVDGFISHLMLFPEIELHYIDIRPMEKELPNVHFTQADATNLEGIESESIESLSALCSFEHFGLGRYGDEIDPEACFKAFQSAQRVVKRGGVYLY